MENKKYYNDIKLFPAQFAKGLSLVGDMAICGQFNRVILCGMGGSALYVDLINDYFASKTDIKIRIESSRSYSIPSNADENCLMLITSHSGNTEETISCLNQTIERKLQFVVITSGGKLKEITEANNYPMILIPSGIQPRLSTGYFIGSIIKLLMNLNLIPSLEAELLQIERSITIDEEYTKKIAKSLVNKVPIIYATDNIKSIATIAKIKFNENAKTQSFANYFPELNHNEMVGYTNLIMKPFFIIAQSKFTNSQNVKRIKVFCDIMQEKGISCEVINLSGDNVLLEMLNFYYLIDHVTYYLAVEYDVDPEKVDMVEEFKAKIS